MPEYFLLEYPTRSFAGITSYLTTHYKRVSIYVGIDFFRPTLTTLVECVIGNAGIVTITLKSNLSLL